eukprot:scaffold1256_cov150-Skeletonema_menzelii.AAC.23
MITLKITKVTHAHECVTHAQPQSSSPGARRPGKRKATRPNTKQTPPASRATKARCSFEFDK